MDGPMREVEKRYTPSAISVIRELETNLAAAQATIEKQRKVIGELAGVLVNTKHRLCDVAVTCEGCAITQCTYRTRDSLIAYAEKQVEEGK
jgi:hypothetical protein